MNEKPKARDKVQGVTKMTDSLSNTWGSNTPETKIHGALAHCLQRRLRPSHDNAKSFAHPIFHVLTHQIV